MQNIYDFLLANIQVTQTGVYKYRCTVTIKLRQ